MLHRSARLRRGFAAASCVAAVVGSAPEAGAHELLLAHSATPVSTIGVLMPADGGANDHSCTASVIHSQSRDLVLTAAHCIDGTGSDYVFVPKYSHDSRPLGTWQVTALYVDSSWISDQSESADLAILRVAPQKINGTLTNIEDVTGGLTFATGTERTVGAPVTLESYNNDSDTPITCSPALSVSDGQPYFGCDGFVAGSSGSPWMQTAIKDGKQVTQVVGVIGGRHQGGCDSTGSYSSAFEERAAVLYARADAGGPSDDVPTAGDDGC